MYRFNPCSGGSIALGYKFSIGRGDSFPVSILVLVEVLPWVRDGLAPAGDVADGFNPCSGGSIALGR